ncbi:MAG TPA: DUF2905 family protein [Burkholderiales bacterium]|jgi:DUF2905 family protein
MLKWLLTVLIVLVVFSVAAQRLRTWRVPGDFTIPMRGRMYYIPLASTLAFSAAVWLLSRLL